jgi:hypothetical protein
MVYISQNYWVSGLCPSSRILKTRENDVSETGSVSVQILRLDLPNGSNRIDIFFHLRTETDPVSETSCSVVFRISNDVQTPKTQ